MNISNPSAEIAKNPLRPVEARTGMKFDVLHKSAQEYRLPIGATLVFGRVDSKRTVDSNTRYIEIEGAHPGLSRNQLKLKPRFVDPEITGTILTAESLGTNATAVIEEDQPSRRVTVLGQDIKIAKFTDIRGLVFLMPSDSENCMVLKIISDSAVNKDGKVRGSLTLKVSMDKASRYKEALAARNSNQRASNAGGK